VKTTNEDRIVRHEYNEYVYEKDEKTSWQFWIFLRMQVISMKRATHSLCFALVHALHSYVTFLKHLERVIKPPGVQLPPFGKIFTYT
jgi:hypothetical protein